MYPKNKYAPTGGHVVVNDKHEEARLGPGWTDTPRQAAETEAAEAGETPTPKAPKPSKADKGAKPAGE